MFSRLILNKLDIWAKSSNRKPLILRGARQVGKTTVVKLFADRFKHYIYLNLELSADQAFFVNNDIHFLVEAIFFKYKLPKTVAEDTLLFIDEIQGDPNALHLLRYFYEFYPKLAVIAAGSLLETLLADPVSSPVGRVSYLYVQPLAFVEYLSVLQETASLEYLQTSIIPNYVHDALMQHFYRYSLIGGMPEVIAHYIEHHDLVALRNIYNDLLITYESDIEKYARGHAQRDIVRYCINRVPFEVAKRIQFQGFGSSNYGSKEIKAALLLLEKAMLLKLLYPTTTTSLPILPNFKRSPRIQFVDTGLVNAAVGLQNDFLAFQDFSSIYQGRIAEHIVGQELLVQGYTIHRDLAFWVREKKQSSAEVDFVLQWQNMLVPIEVKSGGSGKLKSLHAFMEQSAYTIAVRVHGKPLSIETHKTTAGKSFKLLNLPFYAIHKLEYFLQQHY